MGEGLARAITIGSIVLTVVSLTVAVLFARKASRIRIGFDTARAIVGVGAILAMAAITHVVTPLFTIVLAIAGGLALGFTQGSTLEVSSGDRGFSARRGPIGIALWGAGIVIMQAAGIASRTGVVKIGQTIAWFSVCMGIGLLVGRNGPLRDARRTLAGAGVALLFAALTLPTVVLVGGVAGPATADTPQLTAWELCELVESPAPDLNQNGGDVTSEAWIEVPPTATCSTKVWFLTAGGRIGFHVRQFASDDDAIAHFEILKRYNDDWAGNFSDGRDEVLQVDVGSEGWVWRVRGVDDVALVLAPPYVFLGGASDQERVETVPAYEQLLAPIAATLANIEAFLADAAPPPPGDPTTTTSTDGSIVPPSPNGSGDLSPTDDTTATPPISDDAPIEPEQAAGQAVAGLIAAAAIGLITLGEASGEIGRILGGSGGSGADPPKAPEPFIDPYDQTELEVDSNTGMVWWPWDGGEGRWVDAAVVPALINDWDRELDAETAHRVAAHDAQRERNWADLHDRIGRSEAEDAALRAAEEARLDAFDRYVAGAEGWMERADANSLGILDRIRQRVADQGFATDADIAEARRIANDSRTYWDTMQRMNEEDWVRIHQNHATIIEATAKTAASLVNPIAAGAVFGAAESMYDGKGVGATLGNATLGAGLGWAGSVVGGSGAGKAAMGKIGWGSASGSFTSASETLIRGGTWEDAWLSGKIGFVTGGVGGMTETAAAFGQPTPRGLPTIRTRAGGPRVGYDTPFNPRFRPPERGGVGAMPSRVPTIQVRPGGPRPHYDQPLSPGHVDPNDPRYVPRGTPADQVHTPPSDWSGQPRQIIDTDGPSGGRPPAKPPQVSPVDAFEGKPTTPPASRPPPVTPPAKPPIDAPDGRIPSSKSDWSRDPGEYLDTGDAPGVRPPPDPPTVSPVDATGKPPLGDLPERMPPLQDQLLGNARPTKSGSEIADNMMKQPGHPVPADLEPQPASASPGAVGRIDIDAEGRFVVGGRQVGSLDAETGMLTNQRGERILIAHDDNTGMPVGYLEQPDTPSGLSPTYNGRGELVGHVDSSGRAMIDGELSPVAIDTEGKLVPYEPPPAAPRVGADVQSEGGIGQPRIRDDAAPATGAGAGAPRADVEPTTGPLDGPPPGPATGGKIEIPSVAEVDINPRIPVLDSDGVPTHYIEPGPREIHHDASGNPLFAQRAFPAKPLIQRGGGISAPVQEVFDSSIEYHPLTGENAPPVAPPAGDAGPPGGEAS